MTMHTVSDIKKGANQTLTTSLQISDQSHSVFRIGLVSQKTGMARSTIYAAIAKGLFPRQVSLGARSVGWRSQDIYAFINALEIKGGH